MKPFTKKIVLENGREFYGYGFGADREAINEIVFNTSMVGYQEIMSDPNTFLIYFSKKAEKDKQSANKAKKTL